LVFWGPRHAEESCKQLFGIISEGRYKIQDNSSGEMKSLIGRIHRRTGKKFTAKVKNWFDNNTDWLIDLEVPINPGAHLKSEDDLGDIDILAINKDNNRIYVIECKGVASARNPHEMANELERFIEGSKSWSNKHVRRDRWLRKNIKQLCTLYRLNNEDFDIISIILSSEELPTGYLGRICPPLISFPYLERKGISALDEINNSWLSNDCSKE